MVSNKQYIIIFLFLVSALCLPTSCIYETLDPCPPGPPTPPTPPALSGKLWIEPLFTMHNYKDDNGQYKELFAETTQRIDLFYFDAETGLLQKSFSDQQVPASGTYRIPVDLPGGRYVALAWSNLYANQATAISHPVPQAGVTHLDEMTVYLSESAEAGKSLITLHPTPQLWGTTDVFEVDPAGYEHDSVIPADFIRDTNIIDCYIRWRDKDTKKICPLWMHADSTRIYIDAENSTYALKDNLPVPADSVVYIPAYLTGSLADRNASATAATVADSIAAATLETRFTVMRLLNGRHPFLRITRVQPNGSELEVYRKDLMNDFISHFYKTQESIDREERFVIELEFECEHKGQPVGPDNPDNPDNPDTPDNPDIPDNPDYPDYPDTPDPPTPPTPGKKPWIAVKIIINGWVLIDNGDVELGK